MDSNPFGVGLLGSVERCLELCGWHAPAVAVQAAIKRSGSGTISDAEREAIEDAVVPWLVPSFTSLGYADPGYGQLRRSAPEQIRAGADDEAEMGAFHDLFQPQRESNIRARLREYLRFGLEAGVFYST